MDNPDAIAQARAIYWQMQDDLLAASPLADIAAWVASGSAPPAAELRAVGFAGPAASDAPGANELRLVRRSFVRQWGFAIPCAEAITALRRLGPIVEVGAGAGYWSVLLRAAGHDAVATDAAVGGTTYGFSVGGHGPVEQLSAMDAVRAYPDRDLFCCWPSAGEAWMGEAARTVAPGRRIALILDDRAGVTADASLERFLAAECRLTEAVEIPQFPGVCDRLRVYERGAGGG
jgi:hypothetical protein